MMTKKISEIGIETGAAEEEEEMENLEVEAGVVKIEEDIIEATATGVEAAEAKEEEAATEMIGIDPPEMMNSDKVIKSNIGVVVEDPNLQIDESDSYEQMYT